LRGAEIPVENQERLIFAVQTSRRLSLNSDPMRKINTGVVFTLLAWSEILQFSMTSKGLLYIELLEGNFYSQWLTLLIIFRETPCAYIFFLENILISYFETLAISQNHILTGYSIASERFWRENNPKLSNPTRP
jgi:hypothetical protein